MKKFWSYLELKIENLQIEFLASKNDRNSLFRLQNAKFSDFGMIETICKNSKFFTHLPESLL